MISDVIDELTPDELLKVYDKLDIPYREVEKAHAKAATNDPDEKAKTVFRRWVQKNGSKATRQSILDALSDAGLINTKELLEGQWGMQP